MDKTKICKKCGRDLELRYFQLLRGKYYHTMCTFCKSLAVKEYYANNKGARKIHQKPVLDRFYKTKKGELILLKKRLKIAKKQKTKLDLINKIKILITEISNS